MRNLRLPGAAVVALATGLLVPAAAGAQGPPPPTAANGAAVKTLAHGVPTPTEFAFARRNVFVGAYGPENGSGGGVYRIRKGKAKRVRNSGKTVSGVAWRKGKLYVASGPRIFTMSAWNGRRFLRKRTIYTAPAGFSGFTGLAFGPDQRLYSGVGLNDQTDQGPDTGPFARSVVSMTARGKDLKTV